MNRYWTGTADIFDDDGTNLADTIGSDERADIYLASDVADLERRYREAVKLLRGLLACVVECEEAVDGGDLGLERNAQELWDEDAMPEAAYKARAFLAEEEK